MSNSVSSVRTRASLRRLCIAAALSLLPTLALASSNKLPAIIDEARKAVVAEQYEEATRLYTEVWNLRPSWHADMVLTRDRTDANTSWKVYASVSEIGSLALTYPPARDVFMQLRDEAEKKVLTDLRNPQQLFDLLNFNESLGLEDSSILLFDEFRKTDDGRGLLSNYISSFERLLVKKNRWADLGELYGDPLEIVARHAESFTRSKQVEKRNKSDRRWQDNSSSSNDLKNIGILYAALLAANREDDAQNVAKYIMDSDPDARIRIILAEAALGASQCRPIHIEWCTTAGQEGFATDGLIIQIKRELEKNS